jgi:hypothetical protein
MMAGTEASPLINFLYDDIKTTAGDATLCHLLLWAETIPFGQYLASLSTQTTISME